MRSTILAALATTASLLMSACGSAPAAGQASDPAPVSSRCNAAPAQFAMGRNVDAALENEARTRAGAKTVADTQAQPGGDHGVQCRAAEPHGG